MTTVFLQNVAPCWKSVLPHPRINRASPVKAIPFSCHTKVIQPERNHVMNPVLKILNTKIHFCCKLY